MTIGRTGGAEQVAVPVAIQAELLAKVASYDRRLVERAEGHVHVLVLTRIGNDDSARAATQLITALRPLTDIGTMPHDEAIVGYTSAEALAQLCRARRVSIVYVTPGLGEDIEALRVALTSVDVLSVGAVADYVPRGMVLGFDLTSGKPKLLVNLAQARKQGVAFRADVLKMMRVYE